MAYWVVDGLTVASLCWAAAAVMTFIVMFPFRYAYHDASPESVRAMHTRVVQRKYRLLVVSGVLFLIGLLIGLYIFRYGYMAPVPPVPGK